MKTTAAFVLCFSLLIAGVIGGCGKDTPAKLRQTSPKVPSADSARLVADNGAFAFDLYRHLRNDDRNLVFSPYSVSIGLAMTYAGAKGETQQQMAKTLHFSLDQDRLHPAFNALDLDLAARAADAGTFRLNIVNALWAQQDYPFLPEFTNRLAVNYGAGLRRVDFVRQTELARTTINEWISSQTEKRIPELLQPGTIKDLTRLVLTNAIDFKGRWQYPFNHEFTRPGTFTLLSGQEVKVTMMRMNPMGSLEEDLKPFGCAWGPNYLAVEMLYQGDQISMIIILPGPPTPVYRPENPPPGPKEFKEFEDNLTWATYQTMVTSLREAKPELHLPRFEFTFPVALKKTLSEMGMGSAFSGPADFSGMTGKPDLFIDDVIHQARILVDENGTEASAATAVPMCLGGGPARFIANRPYLFLIRDRKTNAILFLGRVLDPRQHN